MYIYFICSYCSIFLINIEYKTRRILPLFFANLQNENFHDCTGRERIRENILLSFSQMVGGQYYHIRLLYYYNIVSPTLKFYTVFVLGNVVASAVG